MSRISYRNYPILQKLKDEKLGVIPILEIDKSNFEKISQTVKQIFEAQSPFYKKRITYVSENFVKATFKAKDKLSTLINEYVFSAKDFKEYGTFIFNNKVIMYCFYAFEDSFFVGIWKTNKDGIFDYIYYNANQEINFSSNAYSFKSEEENKDYGIELHATILMIIFFKKYASVETVRSKAKSKTTQFGCKYLNETDLDIEYLDSKWFTTLVNSKGFKVRGFFRLQPKKKNGEWTKELIWIEEFEKQGYNRQAKILNEE